MQRLVAPEARLLVAAEGDRDVAGVEGVDPDHAGPDGAGEPVGPVEVARPDAGRQAIRRVVGDGQRVRLVLELGDRQHRPEDLLARHTPAVVHAVEDGRFDVEAAALDPRPLSSGHDPGPFAHTEVDVAEDLLELSGVDHRAQASRRVERLARRHLTAERRDPLDELLADAAVDDEARARVAGLAAVVEDACGDGRRRDLQIAAVGQHDLRALAAELERDDLDVGLADVAHQ